MSGPGVVFKDLLPTPDSSQPVTEPENNDVSTTMRDESTTSHALAMAEPEEKGAAQIAHNEEEVADLGWNEPPSQIANPLVGGLKNEDLWILVRRFNKQMYHLKEVAAPVPGGLDLNIADEEEFSPDKLRGNIERLYMTVGIGFITFGKHVARLRSWREMRRTAWFCSAYTLAWIFDLLTPFFAVVLIALILSPRVREVMFPPAPIALVSSTGGVQKPKAGVLGSHDSVTGAAENHKGEAVEQEASNFVTGIASVALSSATGKHPQGEPEDEDGAPAADTVPDPSAIALGAANAKDAASGVNPSATHDKTKVPMETAMWSKMRPVMHGLADVADTWERFANALSPTPPYPKRISQLRLASLVVPLLLVSLFVSSYMFIKGMMFGIGFGFFGDPIITPGIRWLNSTFPRWQKLLEVRNTILKGVPTNAQLTITLLRVGEANKSPLPPPPRTSEAPAEESAKLSDENLRAAGGDWPLNATTEELDEAMKPDATVPHETSGTDINASKPHKHSRTGSKILGFFKGTAKASVNTAITADTVKAKAGSDRAKDRLGVVPPKEGQDLTSGPVEFKCRFHGKKGHVYIASKATIPCLAFSTDSTIEKIGTRDREDLHPAWSIPVGDVSELKKLGGFGWKAKLVVGWALGREVADGLEIVDRRGGVWKITALPLRDELFNRLASMGGQKWEAW